MLALDTSCTRDSFTLFTRKLEAWYLPTGLALVFKISRQFKRSTSNAAQIQSHRLSQFELCKSFIVSNKSFHLQPDLWLCTTEATRISLVRRNIAETSGLARGRRIAVIIVVSWALAGTEEVAPLSVKDEVVVGTRIRCAALSAIITAVRWVGGTLPVTWCDCRFSTVCNRPWRYEGE